MSSLTPESLETSFVELKSRIANATVVNGFVDSKFLEGLIVRNKLLLRFLTLTEVVD